MRVIVAIDGSECSTEAVTAVAKRCWPPVTEFEILHVSEPFYIQYTPTGFSAQSMIEAQHAQEEYMRTTVGETMTLLKTTVPNCVVEGKVINGPVAMTILEEAGKFGADLIVLGSHGRTGLEKFLIGSVAQRVAMNANCSVEVVKKKLINNDKQNKTRKATKADDKSVLKMSSHKPKPSQSQAQCRYDSSAVFSATDALNACTCTPDIAGNLCHCQTLSNPWARHKITVDGQKRNNPSLIGYIKASPGRMSEAEQLNMIQHYCLQHGFRLHDTFVQTEENSGHLPKALEAMQDYDGLIAVDLNSFVEHKSDRIRDLRPFVHHFFCHGKKHLIAIAEGIDTATSAGQLAAMELMNSNEVVSDFVSTCAVNPSQRSDISNF